MFGTLTSTENTELYLTIRRGFAKLDKAHGMLIDLHAYEACDVVSAMSGELIALMEDLNEANAVLLASVPGLAEHTAAACDTIQAAGR